MSPPLTATDAPSINGIAQAFPVAIATAFAIVSIGLSSRACTVSPTKLTTGSTISSKTKSTTSVIAPATQSITSVIASTIKLNLQPSHQWFLTESHEHHILISIFIFTNRNLSILLVCAALKQFKTI